MPFLSLFIWLNLTLGDQPSPPGPLLSELLLHLLIGLRTGT